MAPRLLTIATAKVLPIVMLLLVALGSVPAESAAEKAAPGGNPFDQLKGDWTGGGIVTPAKGGTKKVSLQGDLYRCRQRHHAKHGLRWRRL